MFCRAYLWKFLIVFFMHKLALWLLCSDYGKKNVKNQLGMLLQAYLKNILSCDVFFVCVMFARNIWQGK